MHTSDHIQFSAYCHECRTPIEVIPATEDLHHGLALNHSKGYGAKSRTTPFIEILTLYKSF